MSQATTVCEVDKALDLAAPRTRAIAYEPPRRMTGRQRPAIVTVIPSPSTSTASMVQRCHDLRLESHGELGLATGRMSTGYRYAFPGDHAERDWARAYWSALAPYQSSMYVNFMMDEGEDRVRQACGPAKFDRLKALKRRYDPDNLLRLNQNIPARLAGRIATKMPCNPCSKGNPRARSVARKE